MDRAAGLVPFPSLAHGAHVDAHYNRWKQGFFKSDQHLSQAVLGSLIHRVALDLEHDPSTKLEWLSHLLLQFRPRDPSIASHSQHILHHTTHHLNALLSNYPHHPLSTNIRLLLHMANSLV